MPARCVVLVTDRRRLSPECRTPRAQWQALEGLLEQAVDAAVDVIQVREPDADAGVLAQVVARLVRQAERTGVRVVVNDRADVAWVSGAAGVHLPSQGLAAARVRAWRPDWLIGRSVHVGDAVGDSSADYLVFGTVYPSASKPGRQPDGVPALARAVRAATMPVVAIGGITPARAEACAAAGAAGVAAIGLFLPVGTTPEAMGVAAAVRDLRAALARGSALPGFSSTC